MQWCMAFTAVTPQHAPARQNTCTNTFHVPGDSCVLKLRSTCLARHLAERAAPDDGQRLKVLCAQALALQARDVALAPLQLRQKAAALGLRQRLALQLPLQARAPARRPRQVAVRMRRGAGCRCGSGRPACSSGCRYARPSRRQALDCTASPRAPARLGSARVGTPPRTRAPTPPPALHLPSRSGTCAGTRTQRVERARTGAAAPTLADTCHCHLQTRPLPRTDLAQPAVTHAAHQPGSQRQSYSPRPVPRAGRGSSLNLPVCCSLAGGTRTGKR